MTRIEFKNELEATLGVKVKAADLDGWYDAYMEEGVTTSVAEWAEVWLPNTSKDDHPFYLTKGDDGEYNLFS